MNVVRSRRIVVPDGVYDGAVVIDDGRIAAVIEAAAIPAQAEITDYGDLVVMPGMVDSHVHVNEPGRTNWEGFDSATRAAAAGGTTTIIDMPLNSIPATTNVEAFHAKLAAARERCFVDTGFWGGLVPDNVDELMKLAAEGVLGFKCFMVPSGVAEFEHVTSEQIAQALPAIEKLGLPLLVHAELPDPIVRATMVLKEAGADFELYDTYLRSHPTEAEHAAIGELIRIATSSHAHIHIVHLASAQAIPLIRKARARDLRMTVETCPHYLYFAAEDVPIGATQFKCSPPIRERLHQELLWGALRNGDLDFVVSDHSPAAPEVKAGDFKHAWGGIPSLQLRLPVVWSGARTRGAALHDLARWLCKAPARLAGLDDRKGRIAPGMDADLVVWNPDQAFTVDPSQLYHRHPLTPYAGHTLHGVVRATWLGGRLIYDGTNIIGSPGGNLILRDV